MKANDKNWNCPKKHKAREQTIILPYRDSFRAHSIPRNKQYWTMCGQCATKEGTPAIGCEMDQVISSGLIKPDQFYGVEIDTDIHKLNHTAYPTSNFINEDFYYAMITAKTFNPAIVNADLIRMPYRGIVFVSKIMAFLTQAEKRNLLFVANFVVEQRRYQNKVKAQDVVAMFQNNPDFRYAMQNGNWNMIDECYVYQGTGNKSQTTMASFIFVKR